MDAHSRIHLLVVEDNEGDARLLAETLRDSASPKVAVAHAGSLADCLAALRGEVPDAILLDLHLGDSDGLNTLRTVARTAPSTPIIIMTGQDDQGDTAVQTLREGAQDYLLKDELESRVLLRAIRYAMERKENEGRLREVQEQLLQAQRMEAVGRLAGGIAHDFNNLLTIIQGYTRMLQETIQGDDPRSNDLAAILAASERATALTSQLLAYSSKQVMQMRVVDLGAVVAGMQDLLQHTLGTSITLAITKASSPSLVEVDPRQFDQVVMNLATNARDAMPRGGHMALTCRAVTLRELDVRSLLPEIRPGEYVELTVQDDGIGMDEAVLPHIFDPFFTTKPFGQGTGLGLSIVYGIVKQSRGHVWAESKPGVGTTIHILLPRADGAGTAASTSSGRPSEGGSEGVLLVEDEEDILALLASSLRQLGYRVHAARSGSEAIRVARECAEPLALAVMDVVLPDLSGPELFEGLRSIRPEMKALYMSAYPAALSQMKSATGAVPPFISKPFAPDDLAHRIRDVLKAPGTALRR